MKTYKLAIRGVNYHVEEHGLGRPLLLLHGFTGRGAVWRPFADAWPGWRMIAVDLLGHGDTDAPDANRCAMEQQVQDLLRLMEVLGERRFVVLGYSMGGRVALALSVMRPALVLGLVMESSSPGLRTAEERADRRRADERLAAFLEEQGLEPFIERWERLPLFATQEQLPPEVLARQRAIRLKQRPSGLAASLRGLGTGCQPSYWPQLMRLRMPTCLVTGDQDEKYTRIAEQMQERNPHLGREVIQGAGHTVHLERPDAFAETVARFLRSLPPVSAEVG
ncbi:2-succinyl-6-hydroxy-2,4-cyclohexadiene-1-carboxylate synthase [Alicyclobacillus shizuokensis]|uniref:2-succinyl-6-hydroxy-2, 4-cyclohexadiene-1-carboxylate synthase n=1 Tax=Alicyclobacillus shizuokensis TaxID=392014 RepID=UPI0008313EB3|nr:2-succinyl-6-hydroxy-2,4-cyclohexadiene-1-carboxylate synthase [Alicyclobacillus shizuokensis]MCL6626857.1 2-succinyl-6-hydroxy-2,4-cyclohexadiene-1-carboxylate synthase [Alicyclobacillus shizuokensis]